MDTSYLLDLLRKSFSEADLKELCFRLQVEYADLEGATRREKAMALIAHTQKQGRTATLTAEMGKMRPHLPLADEEPDHLRWIDEVAAGLGQANQAQITSQTNKLKDIREPDKPGPVTNAASLRRNPPPEMPTTRWEDEPALPPNERHQTAVNPYYAGRMVTDKAMFFGRDEERRRLRTRLQNMGSSAIVGMRRIGKSSLLYYLSHHEAFGGDWQPLFAYLDLQDARYHTLTGLLNGALGQWAAALGQEDIPRVTGLAPFSEAVQRLGEGGHHLVLCLDEFEQLTKRPEQFNDAVFEGWRALGNSGHLAFVTVSHQPLADLIKQSGLTSNFDNIFTQLDLGLLDETSALALVREPAQQYGITLPAGAVDELLLLGGTHPFYLQMAAHHLVNLLQMGSFHTAQLKQDFLHEAEPYWRRLWMELLPLQQKLLVEVMQPDPPLVIKRQFRQLERRGVLREDAGAYRPFSAAFGAWLDKELHLASNQDVDEGPSGDQKWLKKLQGLWKR